MLGVLQQGQLVAQVVEAKVVPRAVGDVALVGGALLRVALLLLQVPYSEAQPGRNGGGEFKVALREVGVHRGHVDAPLWQGPQACRQGGDEGLALPSGHLGDGGLQQGNDRPRLAGVGAQATRAKGGLFHHRQCFRQDPLQSGELSQQVKAPLAPLPLERLVRKLGDGFFPGQGLFKDTLKS